MGLSKYFEDNMEMWNERQRERNDKGKTAEIEAALSARQKPRNVIVFDPVEAKTKQALNKKQAEVPAAKSKKEKTPEKAKIKAQWITCQNCKDMFCFTRSDQEFYKQNGWCPPKRCKKCRAKRRGIGQGQEV